MAGAGAMGVAGAGAGAAGGDRIRDVVESRPQKEVGKSEVRPAVAASADEMQAAREGKRPFRHKFIGYLYRALRYPDGCLGQLRLYCHPSIWGYCRSQT